MHPVPILWRTLPRPATRPRGVAPVPDLLHPPSLPRRRRFLVLVAAISPPRWRSSMARYCRSRARDPADLGATSPKCSGCRTPTCFSCPLLLIGGAAGDRFGLRNIFGLGIVLFVVASLALRPCARCPLPDRRPRGAGRGRCPHGAGQPRHHRQGLPARRTRQGHRPLVFLLVAHDDSRARHRRPRAHHAGRLELAAGLRHQPAARRHRPGRCSGFASRPIRPTAAGPSTSSVARSSPSACCSSPSGSPARSRAAPLISNIVIYTGLGLAFLAAFLFWEARAKHPMLPLHHFRRRAVLRRAGPRPSPSISPSPRSASSCPCR